MNHSQGNPLDPLVGPDIGNASFLSQPTTLNSRTLVKLYHTHTPPKKAIC